MLYFEYENERDLYRTDKNIRKSIEPEACRKFGLMGFQRFALSIGTLGLYIFLYFELKRNISDELE